MIDVDFWKGRRVFLTGHTGIKGSWAAMWLQAMGAEVTGYSLEPPTDPSFFELAGVAQGMDHHIGDIRDHGSLFDALEASRAEIVIHMAAQALVRRSYVDPLETYSTNVMGTANLLDAVRQCESVRAVVSVTSDKCYENKEWDWGYRENDPMGGYDPYSSSKGCAELVTASYRQSFFNTDDYASHGVAVATVRAGNIICGGDWAEDRLVPDIVRAIIAGEQAVIRFPEAIRPWQHVLDPLSGYFTLAEKLYSDGPAFAEAWNFGPGSDSEQPVRVLADQMATLWGDGASWKLSDDYHPHEAGYLKLDCSKARAKLGWRPMIGLEAALEACVSWYKAYSRGDDLKQITLDQINAHQSRLIAAGRS